MNVGFTGTRKGMNSYQWHQVLQMLVTNKPNSLHHGGCVGADDMAHKIAELLEIRTVIHPPTNDKLQSFAVPDELRDPKPYLERNHDIVDETGYLIACPGTDQEVQRSGTWATIRYAKKQGKEVWIFFPDRTESP